MTQQTPASPVEFSPLSTPWSDPGAHVSNLEDGLLNTDANTPAAPAKEDSQAQELMANTDCPHCGKTYASERKRDRHVKDKKTSCYKAREAANVAGNSWSCPRCKMRFSKIFSAERHIKETCWKHCDQCCERELIIRHSKCDSLSKEGGCSNCDEAGLACSKQTEQVPDCVAELLASDPIESGDAPDQAADTSRAKRKKRKADQSPETSPQSKPTAKRKTKTGLEKGHAAPKFRVVDKVDDDDDDAGTDKPYPAIQKRRHGIGHPGRDQLPSPSVDHMDPQSHQSRYNAIGYPGAVPAHPRLRMLPPLPGDASYGGPPGSLCGPTMQEMLHRQLQAVRGMGLTPQHAPGHGASTNQEQVLVSSLGETDHEPDFDVPPIRGVDHPGSGSRPGDTVRRHESRPLAMDETWRRKFAAPLTGQGSVPGLNVPSRRSSLAEDQRSAPVSRAASRQASRQSSVERVRDTFGGGAFDHGTNQNNDADRGQRVVKLPLPQVLKHEVTYSRQASPAAGTPTSLIRLRIHSNTFDATGLAIFSILAMGPGEIFGPRLEYYCAQRGKRYGIDWKFVFKYDAPIAGNQGRKKYFDLLWNMTPSGCHDHEYPDAAMGDGDTLLVVNRRPITSQVEHDDLGTALEPQRILFKHGEDLKTKSEIFQNPSVNAAWYKDAERSIVASKKEIGYLRDEIGYLRHVHREDEIIMAEQRDVIAQLNHQLAVVGGGQGPGQPPRPHPQQFMSMQEAAYREQMRRNQGAGQIGPRSQLQERTHLPRANHPQPPGRRRARVSGAAERVGAEGERKM